MVNTGLAACCARAANTLALPGLMNLAAGVFALLLLLGGRSLCRCRFVGFVEDRVQAGRRMLGDAIEA
jgi:hypothetical protein